MKHSEIYVNKVWLSYPILGADSRSLKHSLVQIATGGKIQSSTNNAKIHVNALVDISFHLKAGDFVGLIGHNGAGKSTLLKVLGGIFTPTRGTIGIKGDISTLFGVSVGMQPELTGYENIKIRGIIEGFSKTRIKQITEDVENFTELGDYLSMPVKVYSSGMMTRLAFAISTAITPDILLLDEVVGAGDARFLEKAKLRMRDLIDKANILVLASHSTEIIKQFCNKAIWLEHGEIKAFGNVERTLAIYTQATAL